MIVVVQYAYVHTGSAVDVLSSTIQQHQVVAGYRLTGVTRRPITQVCVCMYVCLYMSEC